MNERVETGHCFCGAVAAEMRGEPFWICYDHDDDCRRAVGGPLTVWVAYRPSGFRWSKGNPKTYSGTKGVNRTFCPECGSSISYADEGLADELFVTIGFFDNPERFVPQAHAYWKMKVPWISIADDLPKVDRYTRQRDSLLGNPNDR
jgi:hypothetical protein